MPDAERDPGGHRQGECGTARTCSPRSWPRAATRRSAARDGGGWFCRLANGSRKDLRSSRPGDIPPKRKELGFVGQQRVAVRANAPSSPALLHSDTDAGEPKNLRCEKDTDERATGMPAPQPARHSTSAIRRVRNAPVLVDPDSATRWKLAIYCRADRKFVTARVVNPFISDPESACPRVCMG
jgi:hypothetical protein